MKKYDKLVRDNIPSIIEGNGDVAKFHIASGAEYEEKLHAKLREEVEEFIADESVEELADIMEVIHSICKLHKFDLKEIESERIKKKTTAGGFDEKIILDGTE